MRYLAVAGRGRRAKREAKQRAVEVFFELAAEEQVGGELFGFERRKSKKE